MKEISRLTLHVCKRGSEC